MEIAYFSRIFYIALKRLLFREEKELFFFFFPYLLSVSSIRSSSSIISLSSQIWAPFCFSFFFSLGDLYIVSGFWTNLLLLWVKIQKFVNWVCEQSISVDSYLILAFHFEIIVLSSEQMRNNCFWISSLHFTWSWLSSTPFCIISRILQGCAMLDIISCFSLVLNVLNVCILATNLICILSFLEKKIGSDLNSVIDPYLNITCLQSMESLSC